MPWGMDNRDHRKLIIIDGRVAFVGSMNIHSMFGRVHVSAGSAGDKVLARRNTDVEIRGPVVARFQRLFLRHWVRNSGQRPQSSRYFPELNPAGNQIVRVVASGAHKPDAAVYATLLSAINSAERSIYITDAFFAPNERFVQALMAAARRGVDVELILPANSPAPMTFEAGRFHYTELLGAGVKIYERQYVLLHAKTMVVDGVWATVGSSNFDWRSFLHNEELNALILDRDFADRMETLFFHDRRHSNAITMAKWQHRPVWERVRESFAGLLEWWR